MREPIGRESALGRLRAVLERRPVPGVAAAYVFGSADANRMHRDSDVDLGVLLDRRVHPDSRSRFEARLDLCRHLSPAVVGRPVDIVILNDAPPLLGRGIVRGERIYCASADLAHAYERDIHLRAADVAPFIEKMRRRLLATLGA